MLHKMKLFDKIYSRIYNKHSVDEEKICGNLKRANGWCEFVIEIYGGTSELNLIN